MVTVVEAKILQFFKRVWWLIVVVLLILLYSFLTGPKFGQIREGLAAPQLPPATEERPQVWLQQNWNKGQESRFHHASQGTQTIPIPLKWFLALEQPRPGLFSTLYGREKRFTQPDYLRRMGFIRDEKSADNPHGLPVGFAITEFQSIEGASHIGTAVGLTCAACHTGRVTYDGVDYIVEGGSVAIDLGLLTKGLGAAIGQTVISSKLPILNGRWKRFSRRVLKSDYSEGQKLKLAAQLESVLGALATKPSRIETVEGFARLDALNRIGNQVFAVGPHRTANYMPIQAPVNYPHLWTTSWFDWVQYDGSIMQPLIRNAGEALGVNASLNTSAPLKEGRFSSAVPLKELYWIEGALAGLLPPAEKRRFDGLQAPAWPDAFPPIDTQLAATGADLYSLHCQGCHLPPTNTEGIWAHFKKLEYYVDGKRKETKDKLLGVKIIPVVQIGTDDGQSKILEERTINTAGIGDKSHLDNTKGIGIHTTICTLQNGRLKQISISDGPNLNFGLALGAIVQQANDAWFDEHSSSEGERRDFEGNRPNCLEPGRGYKARPLNGVWATAPFLHNGSVPTIMDLLGPVEDRPPKVLLGRTEFDVNKLGLVQPVTIDAKKHQSYTDEGLFILDTTLMGNSNAGHEFSARYDPAKHYKKQIKGVIGPALNEPQRLAILEYLKTLSDVPVKESY